MTATRDSYQFFATKPEEIVREVNFLFQRLAERNASVDVADGIYTFKLDVKFLGAVEIYDADGTIIHAFGES